MCDDDVDECGGLEVSSRDVSVPSLMPEEPAVFTQSRGEPIAIARNLGKTSSCPQIFSHASLPTGSEQPVESQSDCVWPLVCESGSGIDRDAPNFRESSALSTCCSLLTLSPPPPPTPPEPSLVGPRVYLHDPTNRVLQAVGASLVRGPSSNGSSSFRCHPSCALDSPHLQASGRVPIRRLREGRRDIHRSSRVCSQSPTPKVNRARPCKGGQPSFASSWRAKDIPPVLN